MKICVVSFSSRAGGNCSRIGKLICSLLDNTESFDFSSFTIHPCGQCGYECFSQPEKCPYSADMEHRLLDAYEKVPKRAVVVSNTNEDNFRRALSYQSYQEPGILFLSAKKYGKESIKGDLLANEEAVRDITTFVRKQ